MLQSPPAWEAGIEIEGHPPAHAAPHGRLPHGRRGLKSRPSRTRCNMMRSPPAWEAGIEMRQTQPKKRAQLVASRMGGGD